MRIKTGLFVVSLAWWSIDVATAWTCRQGITGFCTCPAGLGTDTCDNIQAQCAKTFCSLCLRTAWQADVKVDCSKVPAWKECALFERDLRGRGGAAAAAVAQFQAHVCSSVLGCCDGADPTLRLHVEDALFGARYPLAALPAGTCAAAVRAGGRAALDACSSCRASVRVEIQSDPAACVTRLATTAPGYRPAPFSWEERCEFVSDVVQVRRGCGVHAGYESDVCTQSPLPPSPWQAAYPRLQPALTDAVCACVGCCHEPAPKRRPGGGSQPSPPQPLLSKTAPGLPGAPASGGVSVGGSISAPSPPVPGGSFRFSTVDAEAEAVAELEAAIAAADPGYTCLYDALQASNSCAPPPSLQVPPCIHPRRDSPPTLPQEDAWAAGLLDGESEWEAELRDEGEDGEGEDEEEGSGEESTGPGVPPIAPE